MRPAVSEVSSPKYPEPRFLRAPGRSESCRGYRRRASPEPTDQIDLRVTIFSLPPPAPSRGAHAEGEVFIHSSKKIINIIYLIHLFIYLSRPTESGPGWLMGPFDGGSTFWASDNGTSIRKNRPNKKGPVVGGLQRTSSDPSLSLSSSPCYGWILCRGL